MHQEAGTHPVRVVDAASELVVARHAVAAVLGDAAAVGRELPGHQRHAVGEHLRDELLAAVRPEVTDGRCAGHQTPARGAVGARHLGEDVDRVEQRELGAPELARRHRAEQSRLAQRVHGFGGNGIVACLRGIGVDHGAQLAGRGEE
jgi:hypothetical protein